jgi:hypothetical protein
VGLLWAYVILDLPYYPAGKSVVHYKRLLKGEGRSAALREAQKSMIADPATQHPYYWAAFVPNGNWTPLAAKGADPPE